MILRFSYDMRLDFSAPVSRHYYSFKCVPSSTARQAVNIDKIKIMHECSLPDTYEDFWGTKVIYGCIAQPHTSFGITVSGTAKTGLSIYEERKSNTDIYSVQSDRTVPGKAMHAFYAELAKKAPADKYRRILYFMNCVYNRINYIPYVTDVKTAAETALVKQCGVCQDFSHIMISLLRMDGIPARYVVGMMKGEGQSHAWTEANLGGYWYGFDPTNNLLVDDYYVKISHGRDYRDCIVSRGIFFGIAAQKQDVKVIVEEA